ncbi:MAG: hypothetical protein A3F11_03645 [Gammaproteobacteria bacterium RIFCSPHIGHO2_12_FULL_37_14]|nr:MAG: hypothetical protein A3F11_03645 [Gammaproteobacteria bacterium RIFCSPHIGHO2_12_FULL_37_14]
MKRKYNLALIPASKGDEAIALAKKFSNVADEYLLGDRSFPHVTLYQFQTEEKEIEHIWERVCDIWEEQPLFLTFSKFSCITFDNNIFWVSLLPDNCDTLHKMHGSIANTLRLPIKTTFDPHMTLISTKNKEYEEAAALVSDSYKPITDRFTLSLGVSDDIGQLTNIIYHCDIKRSVSCKL